jgi:predicted transcriptional regulator
MNSVSTQTRVTVIGTSANTGNVILENTQTNAAQTGAVSKAIENAVYAHIQALRGLGQTTANTRSIASALGLPRSLVEQAVLRLNERGVKRRK